MHFDAHWRANGCTSRDGAMDFALATTAGLLLVFTLASLATQARKPSSTPSVLAIAYLALACLYFASVYRYAIRTGLIARYSAETVS